MGIVRKRDRHLPRRKDAVVAVYEELHLALVDKIQLDMRMELQNTAVVDVLLVKEPVMPLPLNIKARLHAHHPFLRFLCKKWHTFLCLRQEYADFFVYNYTS